MVMPTSIPQPAANGLANSNARRVRQRWPESGARGVQPVSSVIPRLAVPTTRPNPPGAVPSSVAWGGSTASRGINELTGWTPRAPLSGQRCLTRRAFELASPLAAGWGMEVGMTIDILRAGLKIEEVEIELRHRATGRDLAAQLHRAKQLRDVTRALVARGGVNADSAREAAKSGLAELKDAGGGLLKRLRR